MIVDVVLMWSSGSDNRIMLLIVEARGKTWAVLPTCPPGCPPQRAVRKHHVRMEELSIQVFFFFFFPAITMKCHRLHSPSLLLSQRLSAESTLPPANRVVGCVCMRGGNVGVKG